MTWVNVNPDLVCRCGHTGDQHEDSIEAPCLAVDCQCPSFDEDDEATA